MSPPPRPTAAAKAPPAARVGEWLARAAAVAAWLTACAVVRPAEAQPAQLRAAVLASVQLDEKPYSYPLRTRVMEALARRGLQVVDLELSRRAERLAQSAIESGELPEIDPLLTDSVVAVSLGCSLGEPILRSKTRGLSCTLSSRVAWTSAGHITHAEVSNLRALGQRAALAFSQLEETLLPELDAAAARYAAALASPSWSLDIALKGVSGTAQVGKLEAELARQPGVAAVRHYAAVADQARFRVDGVGREQLAAFDANLESIPGVSLSRGFSTPHKKVARFDIAAAQPLPVVALALLPSGGRAHTQPAIWQGQQLLDYLVPLHPLPLLGTPGERKRLLRRARELAARGQVNDLLVLTLAPEAGGEDAAWSSTIELQSLDGLRAPVIATARAATGEASLSESVRRFGREYRKSLRVDPPPPVEPVAVERFDVEIAGRSGGGVLRNRGARDIGHVTGTVLGRGEAVARFDLGGIPAGGEARFAFELSAPGGLPGALHLLVDYEVSPSGVGHTEAAWVGSAEPQRPARPFPEAYFKLLEPAFAQRNLGNWSAALRLFQKADGNWPNRTTALALCEVFVNLGRAQEARRELERFLRLTSSGATPREPWEEDIAQALARRIEAPGGPARAGAP